MTENGKRVLWTGNVLIAAFAVWTVLVQIVDVQPIGPNAAKVGFAVFNGWFHQWTGVHMTLYTVTDWLGLVPILICVVFSGVGLIQLVKRRSIFKVDRDILFLGAYYIAVISGYLFFEMFPINFRPILIEGRQEASYPSSTTLLVLSVMPTLAEQIKRRSQDPTIKKLIYIFVVCFSAFMVVCRLVSGVHWFTDIVGAILLSAGLFCMYKASVLLHKKREH